MMLTPEQLAAVRTQFEKWADANRYDINQSRIGLPFADWNTNKAWKVWHAAASAQQASIAELEENAAAHALAMKAGKAMLQAETERADNADARAKMECAQNTSLLYLLAQIREACGDNGKRMQDELVVYISGLHQDAISLRKFAAKVAQQTA